ncbi:galactokinase family protein [Proteiniclasticum ruminis]|uniref:Galactokinase/ectonucleotide pyrophosphatase/phosphodiesterase family member 1/3/galacturonokinase n=1 Tax=Proteiniclasticum ruminis TaxID=398199 RepID=A0A1G8JNS3_9CLOT|nr:galactokinase family protein [Proteiniclasticum ruminis]SDI32812.1 galactokinase/ectonucleotide pyrophosphatase/phosphodiesterase family member 1/3/galacturonokinase [Proteiniclasticum ruminis]
MKDLSLKLVEKFKATDIRAVRSPLRICPLGAHVDHQGGLVTGVALDSSINLVYTPSTDGYIRIQSQDFPDEEMFHLDHVPEVIPGSWGNYIKGAALSLKRDYILRNGINGIVSGKLPIGGLSSSAAVTTAYLMALCDVNNIKISKLDLVQYSHWVETQYIGLKNGILDQSANILSENNKLMVMDCKSNEYKLENIGAIEHDLEFVIVYSGISTSLIRTDYNNRVDECKVSSWLLHEISSMTLPNLKESKLRDIDPSVFEEYSHMLPGRFKRRAKHYFSEQKRVKDGIEAWKRGDLRSFGQLMNESGDSSVHQYECGCPELITIFDTLKNSAGVYGARFSGAGYRGCCIGLINPAFKKEIEKTMDSVYPVKHPKYKDLYKVHFCKIADGAHYHKI